MQSCHGSLTYLTSVYSVLGDHGRSSYHVFLVYSNTAVVQFSPITYTVTEGLDEFAILQLIRSGRLTGSSVVTVTSLQGTASGMRVEHAYNFFLLTLIPT